MNARTSLFLMAVLLTSAAHLDAAAAIDMPHCWLKVTDMGDPMAMRVPIEAAWQVTWDAKFGKPPGATDFRAWIYQEGETTVLYEATAPSAIAGVQGKCRDPSKTRCAHAYQSGTWRDIDDIVGADDLHDVAAR